MVWKASLKSETITVNIVWLGLEWSIYLQIMVDIIYICNVCPGIDDVLLDYSSKYVVYNDFKHHWIDVFVKDEQNYSRCFGWIRVDENRLLEY